MPHPRLLLVFNLSRAIICLYNRYAQRERKFCQYDGAYARATVMNGTPNATIQLVLSPSWLARNLLVPTARDSVPHRHHTVAMLPRYAAIYLYLRQSSKHELS